MIEFDTWMTTIFPSILFRTENVDNIGHTPITAYLEPVYPLRLRVVKTQDKDCPRVDEYDIDNLECYSEDYEVESNRYKDDLLQGGTTWTEYSSAEDTEIDMRLTGEFSSYDGSGYYRDIDMNDYTDETFIANVWNILTAAKWFDRSTRAFFITFTMYDANADKWIAAVIMFEFGISGIVNPTK